MFDKVDKITAGILAVCIIVVGILAYGKDISGDVAIGFITGICTALLSHGAVAVATYTKPTDNTPTPTDTNVGSG